MQKKKLINLRLAMFIAISLCFGILSAYSFKFVSILFGIVFICAMATLSALFLYIYNEKGRRVINIMLIVLFATFFMVGFLTFSLQVENYSKADLNGHTFNVSGKIIEIGKTDTGNSLVLDNVTAKGIIDGKLKYKISVYVTGENTLDVGDFITFSSTLKDKNLTYENTFSPYDMSNGIKYMANVQAEEVKVVEKRLNAFETCNVFIRDTLKAGLDYNEFTVAYAMLTGNSEMMDDNVMSNYRYLGVAHIFAVSGLHIGFLATALNFLLDKLRIKRIIKAIVIAILLVFYSGICGFTASSIRATVMSVIMMFLTIKGERYDGLSAVSIAGVVILLFAPVQLFCVGFQLSFGVVLGILFMAKPIENFLVNKVKFLPKRLSKSIGVVLSAQISGIPISLLTFGYFSPLSIVVNFIFIPVISVIFYSLIILTLLGGLLTIPRITLFILNYALKFINLILTVLDGESLLVSGLTFGGFAIIYYAIMIIQSGVINLRRIAKTISTIIMIIVFISGTVVVNVSSNKYVDVYVCGSESACVTVIEYNNENLMVVSDVNKIYSLGNMRRLNYKNGITHIDTVVICGGFKYDMQVFVTKLRQVFSLHQIYYYGETNVELELLMQKSFNDLKVDAYSANQQMPMENLTCNFVEKGVGVDLTIKGKRIVITANTDEPSSYGKIGANMSLLVASQSIEQLEYKLNPEMVISYRSNTNYDDGESNGNYHLSFK